MKVVVTGASGRVGGPVMGCLADLGWEVIGQARSGPSRRVSPRGTNIDVDVFDLADLPALERFLARCRPTAILHFAGLTPRRGNGATEAEYARANVDLTRLVCMAAHRYGVRHVLLASTASVYATPTGETPILEEDALRPSTPYGTSKRAMENWAVADGPTLAGMTLTRLRYGNIAGADAWLENVFAWFHARAGELILDSFASRARGGDPSPLRSYIAIEEVAGTAAALLRALGAGAPVPGVLNVAAPHPVTMLALLRSFERLCGATVPFAWRPAPVSAIDSMVLDTGRLQSLVALPSDAGSADHLVASAIGHRLE